MWTTKRVKNCSLLLSPLFKKKKKNRKRDFTPAPPHLNKQANKPKNCVGVLASLVAWAMDEATTMLYQGRKVLLLVLFYCYFYFYCYYYYYYYYYHYYYF